MNFKTDFTDKLNFSLWLDKNCNNCQINASFDEKEKLKKYFWYYPLGMLKEKFEIDEVKYFMFEAIDKIANYRTRIIQKKGLIFQSFSLEYFDTKKWILFYKHSAFRYGNIEFPKITGDEKIYY